MTDLFAALEPRADVPTPPKELAKRVILGRLIHAGNTGIWLVPKV